MGSVGSTLTVVHSAISCSPSSLNTWTMKGLMLAMPENCCKIKYGTTSISGLLVGGRNISFQMSKLQCEASSLFLSENHRYHFRSIEEGVLPLATVCRLFMEFSLIAIRSIFVLLTYLIAL